ncbi:MAG: hypothetical protein KDJ63_15110 [Nitratireductor sp.]|nr:hypothetical protein [Nitratireductor sp.]
MAKHVAGLHAADAINSKGSEEVKADQTGFSAQDTTKKGRRTANAEPDR